MNEASIVPHREFQENWKALVGDMFDGLDWNNIFVAGGSVLGCLMPGFIGKSNWMSRGRDIGCNGFGDTDLDLFLYGMTVEQARAKIEHIISVVSKNSKSKKILQTKFAVTIFGVSPYRSVQIILRLYKSPAEGPF